MEDVGRDEASTTKIQLDPTASVFKPVGMPPEGTDSSPDKDDHVGRPEASVTQIPRIIVTAASTLGSETDSLDRVIDESKTIYQSSVSEPLPDNSMVSSMDAKLVAEEIHKSLPASQLQGDVPMMDPVWVAQVFTHLLKLQATSTTIGANSKTCSTADESYAGERQDITGPSSLDHNTISSSTEHQPLTSSQTLTENVKPVPEAHAVEVKRAESLKGTQEATAIEQTQASSSSSDSPPVSQPPKRAMQERENETEDGNPIPRKDDNLVKRFTPVKKPEVDWSKVIW
jgi:hypothetical protein